MANKVKDYKAIGKKIAFYIRKGLRPLQAATLAGISHDTYRKYLANYSVFSTIIERAENQLELSVAEGLKDIGIKGKNPQALIAFTERRFSDRWSSKVINELTGPGGAQVTFKVDASGGYIPPNNVLGVPSTLTAMSAVTKVDKSEPN